MIPDISIVSVGKRRDIVMQIQRLAYVYNIFFGGGAIAIQNVVENGVIKKVGGLGDHCDLIPETIQFQVFQVLVVDSDLSLARI